MFCVDVGYMYESISGVGFPCNPLQTFGLQWKKN